MSYFEPDNKRRRLLEDLKLTDTGLGQQGEEEEEEPKSEPMGYDELMDIKYKSCFACEHMHAKAIEANETYAALLRLYTENSANIVKDAIYKKIYEFFQEHIVKDLVEVRKQMIENGDEDELSDFPVPEWSIEGIKEHFECHTNYPTDEILFQIRLKRAVRNKLANNIIEKKPDGTLTFNHKNLDALGKFDKAITDLMKSKKDISSCVGYNATLDY